MRLGVLSREKLKNLETQGRIVTWTSLESVFVMFIAWTSQKASKVLKLLSRIGHSAYLKIQSPHEDNRPVTPVKCTKSRNRGTGTIYDSCRFDIGCFRAELTGLRKVSTSE